MLPIWWTSLFISVCIQLFTFFLCISLYLSILPVPFLYFSLSFSFFTFLSVILLSLLLFLISSFTSGSVSIPILCFSPHWYDLPPLPLLISYKSHGTFLNSVIVHWYLPSFAQVPYCFNHSWFSTFLNSLDKFVFNFLNWFKYFPFFKMWVYWINKFYSYILPSAFHYCSL